MRGALVHRELQGSVRDFRVQWDIVQPRIAEEGREFRDPEDHARGWANQDWVAEQAVSWEFAGFEGLRFRWGLRGSYVDDVAAREAR